MTPPPSRPLLSAVIVNFNAGDLIAQPLESLRVQTTGPIEVIVVDNGSTDGSDHLVERGFPEARLLRSPRNLGFAEGCNHGVARSRGEYVLLLNPDAWLEPNAAAALVTALRDHPWLGVAGGVIRHPDGAIQEAGNLLDRTGFPVPLRTVPAAPLRQDVFFVSGCALVMRRADWDAVDGMDGRYFMFAEEVDLCWRVQLRGLRVGVVRDASIWHVGGATLEGGYVRDGRHRTNARRIYLRERNILATMLKNGTLATVPGVAVGWVLNVGEALLFLALHRPGVSAQYPRALWWNLRNLRQTLAARRRQNARVPRRRRPAVRGWATGSGKLRVLRQGGIPTVDSR